MTRIHRAAAAALFLAAAALRGGTASAHDEPPGLPASGESERANRAAAAASNEGRWPDALKEWARYTADLRLRPGQGRYEFFSAVLTLGNLHAKNLQYTEAVALLREAASLARREPARVTGRPPIDLAEALLYLATVEGLTGREAEAALHLDEAARELEGRPEPAAAAYAARVDHGRARLAYQQGDLARAEGWLRDAGTAVDRAAGGVAGGGAVGGGFAVIQLISVMEPLDVLELLTLRANVHLKARLVEPDGRLDRGGAGLRDARRDEHLEKAGQIVAAVLPGRQAAAGAGATAEAEAALIDALRLAARVAYAAGRYGEARDFLRDAIKRCEAAGLSAPARASLSSDAACAAARGGDLAGAESLLRDASTAFEAKPPPETRLQRWVVGTNLAAVLSARGGSEGAAEALTLLASVLQDLEAQTAARTTSQSSPLRRAYLDQHRWTLGVYLALAASRPAEEQYVRVLRYKAAAFAHGTAVARARGAAPELAGAVGGGPASVAVGQAGRRVDDLSAELFALLVNTEPLESRGPLRELRVRELLAELDRLERLGPKVPAPAAPTPADVVAALPGRAAVVDYVDADGPSRGPGGGFSVRTERGLVAFVVTAGRVRAVPLGAIGVAAVARLDATFDEAAEEDRASLVEEAVRDVADLAWAPVAAHLPADTRFLVICPDGGLWGVPFAAMPDGPGGTRYLVERCTIALAMGAQQVCAAARPGAAGWARDVPRRALLVADLDYGDGPWQPVPVPGLAADLERDYEARHPGGVVVSLTGGGATPGAVLRSLDEGCDDLILCGHVAMPPPARGLPVAEVTPFFPLSGGGGAPAARVTPVLACPPGRRPPEIVGLISCTGAGGVVVRGEGTHGFPRAFLVAGAEAVWSTIWPVRPAWAGAMAGRFLQEHLRNRLPAAEALAAAQRSMIAQKGDGRSSPLVWAGWVVIGVSAEDWQYASLPPQAAAVPPSGPEAASYKEIAPSVAKVAAAAAAVISAIAFLGFAWRRRCRPR